MNSRKCLLVFTAILLSLATVCYGQSRVRGIPPRHPSRVLAVRPVSDSNESIKQNLKDISCACEADQSEMTATWCVIEGNVSMGKYSWSSNSSGKEAERIAKNNCENAFGFCERMFSLYIFNNTLDTIKIYMYPPNESIFRDDNALFFWTFEAGKASNLAISDDNCLLLVPSNFKLRVVSEGGGSWGPKTIYEFNYNLRNYRNGQNYFIHLTER